jgi:hypothetical protein
LTDEDSKTWRKSKEAKVKRQKRGGKVKGQKLKSPKNEKGPRPLFVFWESNN